jgi:hypothetical protein
VPFPRLTGAHLQAFAMPEEGLEPRHAYYDSRVATPNWLQLAGRSCSSEGVGVRWIQFSAGEVQHGRLGGCVS